MVERTRGENSWMPDAIYETVLRWAPLPHVDLVFLRKNPKGDWETLVFDRDNEPFKGTVSLIGGRQFKAERLLKTIARQAAQVGYRVQIIEPFNSEFPAYVDSDLKQAPNKQATTIGYPVKIVGKIFGMESDEVSNPRWVSVNNLPENIISNHKRKILKVVDKLEKFG